MDLLRKKDEEQVLREILEVTHTNMISTVVKVVSLPFVKYNRWLEKHPLPTKCVTSGKFGYALFKSNDSIQNFQD